MISIGSTTSSHHSLTSAHLAQQQSQTDTLHTLIVLSLNKC